VSGGLYRSENASGHPPSANELGTGKPAVYPQALSEVSIPTPDTPLAEDLLPPETAPARKGSVLGSSAMMAVGTLASRLTGFLRTALLVWALGTGPLGDVFNTANTIPNIVFDILLGGVLTAAHVPLLIRARNRSAEYGEQFEQRLFTFLLSALAVITALAMLLAPALISLYAKAWTPDQHRVATLFLLFFLPQIFFYGFSAVAGASLNARASFAAPMWTPVLNNIVVIGVLGAFMATTHGALTPGNITHAQVTLLGVGVTAGVAAQALGLVPALRGIGFNGRPRFDFQRGELTSMWGVASWTLLYVAAQQVALLVYTRLANAAGVHGVAENIGHKVGSAPWVTAYAFFQLPYAVVAISIITAIFPRMTQSAAEGRMDRLVTDLREGLRLSLALLLPAVALLFGAASEICFVLFAHGSTRPADAEMIAQVLRVFAVALTPFAVLQLLQRGFYALSDTKTPALIAIFSTGAGALSAFLLSAVLPTGHVIMGIAAAQGISWSVGCLVSVLLLRRRVGRLGGRDILALIGRASVCSLAALAVAQLGHQLVGPRVHDSWPLSVVLLIMQGVLGLAAFLLAARLVRVPEVNQVVGMARRKLGR
jgi:putative peptidoglycan lipid II flippase